MDGLPDGPAYNPKTQRSPPAIVKGSIKNKNYKIKD